MGPAAPFAQASLVDNTLPEGYDIFRLLLAERRSLTHHTQA